MFYTIDLLYFQFFLSENAYLTLIWIIFTWYYSSIDLINDSFAVNQGKFFHFKGPFPAPLFIKWGDLLNHKKISDHPDY